MPAYTPWEMERKFYKIGGALIDLPGENIYRMAHAVAVNMEKYSPHNKPKVYGRAIIIKRPKIRNSWAGTVVIGRGFAVLAEHGTYHHKQGYPIYPKALTVKRDGFSVLRGSATYKTEAGRRRAATRMKNNATRRGDKHALRIKGGHPFAIANHPGMRGTPYVSRAVEAANKESANLLIKQVGVTLGKMQ
tara:strand:+ start:199 stop:768 length:570 start_codon:yes stop_codon:yes gene_type:complete